MSEISDSELRRLDLTLLLVFLGLLRHRKGTHVAADLGLTQSAISQALKRMRDIFDDELFLRRPHGMEPTAKALALEEPIARAVEALRGVLDTDPVFDPATSQGIVRIAALDAEQSIIVSDLADRFRFKAPGLRLSVTALGRTSALEALQDDRVDLALGYIRGAPDTIRSEPLYDEYFAVVGRDQPFFEKGGATLAVYCAQPHILVSPAGDLRGVVDETLEARGASRTVILASPAFLPALAAAEATGALLTLPSRVAARFADRFELRVAEPPIELQSFPVSTFWHRRNDKSERTSWLRQEIRDVFASTSRGSD